MSLKRTTEEVAEYFKKQGCKLMDEYHGCMEPMDYRCKCGQYGTTTWNNFSRGKRCGHCAKQGPAKKRSLKEVQKIFKDRECEFLDDEFRGIHYKHRYRCKCGREAEITFAAFYHQNQSCYQCGLEKNKNKGHHAWKADRQKKREDFLFRRKCYKALQSTLQATGKSKVGHTSDMLGYGPKELQEHVRQHPNWSKVKDASWHLDHIFPIQAFLEYDIHDIALINSLDNLRPITQRENNQKSAKYNKRAFHKWLKSKGVKI